MAWATFRTLRAKHRTLQAEFVDRRSRIGFRPDGSEFWDLCGVDVGIQRNRVFNRDNQRCQVCERWLMLSECEMDHIRSRGKGGDDSLSNLQTICRKCHREKHLRIKWRSMSPWDLPKEKVTA